MLLVKASPRPSAIHGIGLFADEDIRPGTIVWSFGGEDCRHAIKDVNLWHAKAQEWIWMHGYINPRQPGFLVSCCDDSIYMNFANPANTALGYPHVDGEYSLVCLRYIIRGHEITVPFESDADACRKMNTTQKTK
jgi:hypothetical protein